MTAKTITITTLAVAAGIPLLTTLWLHSYRRRISKIVTIHTKVDTPIPSTEDIKSIPQHLHDTPGNWILSLERASKIIPKSLLLLSAPPTSTNDLDEILVRYLRANMRSFTWTPQAPLLKWMCASPEVKNTFAKEYLDGLEFEVGERVNGVFVVVVHEEGRIELALEPPVGWKGPKQEGGGGGRIVARIEERGGDVLFVNDTVMWRRREGGKPEIIEGGIGGWMHEVMVMWLVDSGTRAVMLEN